MENNKNYMKGFVPYAIAAAILSLCGGFTASVPTAISTAWDADSSLTFITLAYSLAAAAMAPILGKLGGVIGRRKMLLSAMGLYTVGQALIAICPQNIPLLLVFRFMVGIGAAGIAPVVMSYIMMEFPPEKMGQGFTVYMAVACGMVIFGPTVGGIIMKTGKSTSSPSSSSLHPRWQRPFTSARIPRFWAFWEQITMWVFTRWRVRSMAL